MELPLLTPHIAVFVSLTILSLASSTSAVRITNLTVENITTTTATFNWLIVEIDENDNQTDLFRTYVRLKYSLNFDVDSSCITIDKISKTFTKLLPYTGYFACVYVVQLEDDDDECTDDSTIVSQSGDTCASLTTDFTPWSVVNIAALGVAGGILAVVVFALAIQFACPKETLNSTIDKQKMRDWSKKKRTESVRDFLESVDPDYVDYHKA